MRRNCREHNSQLAHDDCRRIRSTISKLAKQTPWRFDYTWSLIGIDNFFNNDVICRHLLPNTNRNSSTAQEIVNWVTTADFHFPRPILRRRCGVRESALSDTQFVEPGVWGRRAGVFIIGCLYLRSRTRTVTHIIVSTQPNISGISSRRRLAPERLGACRHVTDRIMRVERITIERNRRFACAVQPCVDLYCPLGGHAQSRWAINDPMAWWVSAVTNFDKRSLHMIHYQLNTTTTSTTNSGLIMITIMIIIRPINQSINQFICS